MIKCVVVLFFLISISSCSRSVREKHGKPIMEVLTLETVENFIKKLPDIGILVCNSETNQLCSVAIPIWNHAMDYYLERPENGVYKEEFEFGVIDINLEDPEKEQTWFHDTSDGMMYWFKDGAYFDNSQFMSQMNHMSVISWVDRTKRRELDEITPEAVESFKATCNHNPFFLALYDIDTQSREGFLTNEVCRNFADTVFCAAIHDADIIETEFGSDQRPKLIMYSCSDDKEPLEITIEDDETKDSLYLKVMKNLPNFGKISNVLVERGNLFYNLTLMIALEEKDIEFFKEISKDITNAQFTYDYVNLVRGGFKAAGASGTIWPAMTCVKPGEWPVYFDETTEITKESIQHFIDSCQRGDYPLFKRSAPIPDYSLLEDGEIFPLVFKNHDEYIENSDKPVLCLYYIESLADGSFNKAAKLLMNSLESYYNYYDGEIVLAMYDIDLNFPPKLPTVPQFILYSKGEKYVYTGKHTLKPMTTWLNELLFPFLLKDEL